MRRDKKSPLVKRIYKKWISGVRDSAHTVVCMLAVAMFILSRMLGMAEMEVMAYVLFFVNLVIYIFYWNQHKLYCFVNIGRRHVKGIPKQSVRLRNLLMLASFFLLFLAILLLVYVLPLGRPWAKAFEWLYALIAMFLGKIFGRSEKSSKVNGIVSNDMDMSELAMSGNYDRTLLDVIEKVAAYAAILLAAAFAVFMLAYLYRAMKNRLNLELEDEVFEISEEERKEQVQKEKMSRLHLFDRGADAQIRRSYVKLVKYCMKKRSVRGTWTPSEIEEEADIRALIENQEVLHDVYEKARYGKETCTQEEAEEVKKMLRKK